MALTAAGDIQHKSYEERRQEVIERNQVAKG